jgi:DNA-binding transcriptional LysR family regulator
LLQDVRDLECRARRINEGWETELRIGLDTIVPFAAMVPYVTAFYGETRTTGLRFSHEALGGTWDALYSRRADLVIGATGEPPFAGSCARPIGTLDMVFCVAPGHPLAQAPEPLNPREIARYRAIAIGDTSRQLDPRSLALFKGQETVIVASLEAKIDLQLAGLGTGYLPFCVARNSIERGQLVTKQLATPPTPQTVYLAWHPDHTGEALSWWLRNLSSPNLFAEMWSR